MTEHVCPSCNGNKKHLGVFPVWAPGTPQEKKRPYIELDCHFCGGSGTVDDAAIERREKGQRLRTERLARKAGLREEAERLGISAAELSRREQGLAPNGD